MAGATMVQAALKTTRSDNNLPFSVYKVHISLKDYSCDHIFICFAFSFNCALNAIFQGLATSVIIIIIIRSNYYYHYY